MMEENTEQKLNRKEKLRFSGKIVAVVVLTFIVFFVILFGLDYSFGNQWSKHYFRVIERPQAFPELILWFLGSLALSVYIVFRKDKKKKFF